MVGQWREMGRPEGRRGGDPRYGAEAEGPGEAVTLSLFVSPSLPVSELVSSHSCDSVSGSPGLGARGRRARGSGEHAELAVTEPAAARDHAPLRVCGPAAGQPALPGL